MTDSYTESYIALVSVQIGTHTTLTPTNPAFRSMLTASYDHTDSRTVYALPFQLGAPAS